ncbi:MAG: PA4642 family protein [Porticoccaceae bacterium]|nr:PA4642 family protein [Porticoccaceae bacterium]
MSLKKDKQKVLGEVFDDARVKSFLDFLPPEGVSRDYHLLEKAYRGMNIDNFISFVGFFTQAGYDLNATNPDGANMVQIMNQHQQGVDYAKVLIKAGASA